MFDVLFVYFYIGVSLNVVSVIFAAFSVSVKSIFGAEFDSNYFCLSICLVSGYAWVTDAIDFSSGNSFNSSVCAAYVSVFLPESE